LVQFSIFKFQFAWSMPLTMLPFPLVLHDRTA
jgi:hypothetical protein